MSVLPLSHPSHLLRKRHRVQGEMLLLCAERDQLEREPELLPLPRSPAGHHRQPGGLGKMRGLPGAGVAFWEAAVGFLGGCKVKMGTTFLLCFPELPIALRTSLALLGRSASGGIRPLEMVQRVSLQQPVRHGFFFSYFLMGWEQLTTPSSNAWSLGSSLWMQRASLDEPIWD